jgi:hypothetical protein
MTGPAVPVTFLGSLRHVTGQRQTRVELDDGATVADLLALLADRFGPGLAAALFRAPGEVHTHLRVFVDDEETDLTERVRRPGRPAEVAVMALPIFEGGSE